MEGLIPVLNKLQDALAPIAEQHEGNMLLSMLPQIAVLGAQSSGKSSVLESICGRDFLPRGTQMVTRRPLVLQLIPSSGALANPKRAGPRGGGSPDPAAGGPSSEPKAQSPRSRARRELERGRSSSSRTPSPERDAPAEGVEEWAEFNHLPGKRFTDFEQVRAEIEKETDRVAPKNGISPLPITLKIHSPKVIPLTLNDLPGLVKISIGGQPTDLEAQIRKLVLEYISQPNVIILAVTSANTDIANSDALQLAREVDPTGQRTLGVLTKLDLMDRGTDASDLLAGKLVNLPLGFNAVVCRAQEDIARRKPISEALQAEADFFAARAAYRPHAARLGSPNLARRLNRILLDHIRERLPDVKRRIAAAAQKARDDLEVLGESPGDSPATQGAALLSALTQLSNEFRDTIDGKLFRLGDADLYGGARIAHIFHEVFHRRVEAIDPAQELTPYDISVAMRNAAGTKPALFVPDACFEVLVRAQIRRLEEPCLACVQAVYEELAAILSALSSSLEIQRYPVLREHVSQIFSGLLRKHIGPTSAMVSSLIKCETAYINMAHPDFIGWNDAVKAFFSKREAAGGGKEGKERGGSEAGGSEDGDAASAAQGAQAAQGSPVVKEAGNASVVTQRVGNPSGLGPAPKPAALPPPPGPSAPSEEKGLLPWIKGALGGGKGGGGGGGGGGGERPQASHPAAEARAGSSPEGRPEGLGGGRMASAYGGAGPALRPLEALSPREQQLTEIISALLCSYFGVVKKNVQDAVPKVCMAFLVNAAREGLHAELVSALYREDRFGSSSPRSPAPPPAAGRAGSCWRRVTGPPSSSSTSATPAPDPARAPPDSPRQPPPEAPRPCACVLL
eukprot:tig00021312_g20058.t1